MGIGERLKEARQAKQMSLDEIQEMTKIQKRYLVAIEEANFSILPGKFYVRAFIKEYANAVGLDANELFTEFKDEIPSTETDNTINTRQYTRMERAKKQNTSGKPPAIFSFLPTVIVIVLVIVIAFAIWYFYKGAMLNQPESNDQQKEDDESGVVVDTDDGEHEKSDDDDTDKQKEDEKKDEKDKKDDKKEDKKKDKKPELKKTDEQNDGGVTPNSTWQLKNADDKIKVKLEASDETYVGMENEDGKSYYNHNMTPDDSPQEFDVSDDDTIEFNLGNASALKITVNGVKIKYPFDNVHQRIKLNLKDTDKDSDDE